MAVREASRDVVSRVVIGGKNSRGWGYPTYKPYLAPYLPSPLALDSGFLAADLALPAFEVTREQKVQT